MSGHVGGSRRRTVVWGALGIVLPAHRSQAVGALRDQKSVKSTPGGPRSVSLLEAALCKSARRHSASDGGKGANARLSISPPRSVARTASSYATASSRSSRRRLDQAAAQIVAVARDLGGYVLSSAVGSGSQALTAGVDDPQDGSVEGWPAGARAPEYGDGEPYAWLTVRIPADRFDDALLRIGRLGRVEKSSTSTQDVTGEMVDLKARLTHYHAVLARLLTFLDKATSVGSALAIQNRIDETQLTVEQLTAQLKQLEESVSYSTLTVSLSEKGALPVAAHTGGFRQALQHSGRLLASGTQGIIIAIGAALPFLIPAVVVAVLAALAVRVVRRYRQGTTRPPPAAPPQNGPRATGASRARRPRLARHAPMRPAPCRAASDPQSAGIVAV